MMQTQYKRQLYTEICDLRKRRLSIRVSSVLNMIENKIDDQLVFSSYQGKTAIPVLQGNDFGMVFQAILYIPEERKWIVLSRAGKGEINFDALVDMLWYLRSLHLPQPDAIFDKPF